MSGLAKAVGLLAVVTVALAAGAGAARSRVTEFEGAAGDVSLAGPSFAGPEVVWAMSGRRAGLYAVRNGAATPIFVPAAVPLPPEFAHRGLRDPIVRQTLAQVSGSGRAVAFLRFARVHERCSGGPPCEAVRSFPLFSELWVGPRTGGSFRRVGGARRHCPQRQSWPADLDVSGSYMVFDDLLGPCKGSHRLSRVLVWSMRPGARPRVLARSARTEFRLVAAAGRHVAWEQHRVVHGRAREQALVVFDLRRGRPLYRVSLDRLRATEVLSVDVQADGKVAALVASQGGQCGLLRVVWASPFEPRPHILPGRAAGSITVRMSQQRIMYLGETGTGCDYSAPKELLVAGLDGTQHVLSSSHVPSGPFFAYDFDLDGELATYAETVELPPVGNERQFQTAIYLDQAR
jgi:hypothetical protein